MSPSRFRLYPKKRSRRSIDHVTSNFGRDCIRVLAPLGNNTPKHRIVRVTADLITYFDHFATKVPGDLRHIVLSNGVPIICPLQRGVHPGAKGHQQKSRDTCIETRGKMERFVEEVPQIG
jgi:hypothetical protein